MRYFLIAFCIHRRCCVEVGTAEDTYTSKRYPKEMSYGVEMSQMYMVKGLFTGNSQVPECENVLQR